MKESKILSDNSEWNTSLLKKFDQQISKVALEYKLDTYPVQMEIISAEQMMDVYSTVGMPLGYHHWSFGKQFFTVEKNYRQGYANLAYEIVINSNPCIAFFLEENTLTMQAMVIAHACYGHNSFFKSNYLFKTWTNADSIIDYLLFAKTFISECEERYGVEAVESLLDSCHALMNQGVDRYKRPAKLSLQEEKARQKERETYLQLQVNDLWRTIPISHKEKEKSKKEARFPDEPQENLLYFLEKNAPLLEAWQREIIRICRKVAQYFYPQRQTKVMNEGWATFWHYTLINRLYDKGIVNDDFMLEFIHSHSSLIIQPSYDHPHFSGFNPYTLGFAIFSDIKRICESPTDEDREWFPDLVDTDWISALDFSMRNFKDESFIAQYLSPKVIRDLKLFTLIDDDQQPDLQIESIHNEKGYQQIRERLASQYNLSNIDPNIQVYQVNARGDRALTLRHIQHNRKPLSEDTVLPVLKHFQSLWGFDVTLESVDDEGNLVKKFESKEEVGVEEGGEGGKD